MHLCKELLISARRDFGKKLDDALENDLLELPDEFVGLKSFTGHVQREVLS